MSQNPIATTVLALYRTSGHVATPLVRAHLQRRVQRGREDPERLGERLGRTAAERGCGPLLWIHAASVGESLSTLTLLRRLQSAYPDSQILMTTGTLTSARLMAERLPSNARHQFVPVDLPGAVDRFLAHWRPDLAIFVESELWPNLITLTAERAIPMVLLNARMSERSFKGWRFARPVIQRLLGSFTLVLAQSPQDRQRLGALGARQVDYFGNLKTAAEAPSADPDTLAALKALIGQRPVWLAASTHPGEEAVVAEAHKTLRQTFPNLLTLLTPRHPERGPEIAEALQAQGLATVRRSAGGAPEETCEVYLADSLGELGLWYRLAQVVFLGGSLVPIGGHNLLEPAMLGCAILTGPETANFAAIAGAMEDQEALLRVSDAGSLARQVEGLLNDATARATLGQQASTFAASQPAVLEEVLRALNPLLKPLSLASAPD